MKQEKGNTDQHKQRKKKKKKFRGIPSNFRADNDSTPVNDELVHTDFVNIDHVNNESLVVNDTNEPNQIQTSEVNNMQTDKKGVESSSRKTIPKSVLKKHKHIVNTDNLLTGVQKK